MLVKKLEADVILGRQYIDAIVDEINVKYRALIIKSGTPVPILRRCTRLQSAAELLERH